MPNLGIRQRASTTGRKALSVALGTCFAGLLAAAPASAGQLVLSGTSESTACVISVTGALDSCNGSVLDSTSSDEESAVILHFDLLENMPANTCIDDVGVWLYRIVGNPSWGLGSPSFYPKPMYTPGNPPFTTAATWYSPDGVNSWLGGYESGYAESIYEADAHWLYTDAAVFIENDVLLPDYGDQGDLAGPTSANAPKMIVNYSSC